MKTRILTGLAIAILGLPILIFSNLVFYPIVISLLAGLALFELYRVLGLHKKLVLTVPTYLIAVVFPTLVYFVVPSAVDHMTVLLWEALAVFFYLFYALCVAVLSRQTISTDEVARAFFSTAYISLSFTSLTLLRYMPKGAYYIALVFIAAWATDIFAYFVGSFLGKHKLAPVVSPKKSIEGAVGGTVGCVLCFLGYGLVLELCFGVESIEYLSLAIMGLVLSLIAQIGDLACSLVKREHGVKDYGKIFPGHGGVLDRFDSIIAVSTLLVVLCTWLSPLG